MIIQLSVLIGYSLLFGVLFLGTEFFHRISKCKVEYTRKFVHFVTGLIALSFPFFIEHPISISVLCCFFFIMLMVSEKFNLLNSINGVKRKTRGSVIFPMVVMMAFFVQWYFVSYKLYFIPILILTISDPIAGIIGKKVPVINFEFLLNRKSLGGSLSFFISALLISLTSLIMFSNEGFNLKLIFLSLIIATGTTLAEALSINGYDNLSIPLTAISLLLIF